MPDISNSFPQYSNVLADSSYVFDFVKRVTVGASGTANVVFPPSSNVLRFRQTSLYDVTAATGGTNPSLIACYFRLDGLTASAGTVNDGSAARILKPGERVTLNRITPQEGGVWLFNPNGTPVTILVELGA